MSEPTGLEWMTEAGLPDDLRSNQTLQQFKGATIKDVLPQLGKSYVEARSMIGKKAYELPQPDWTPEKYAEWNKTIGVPDSPDKYELPAEDLLNKAGIPKDVLSVASKKFHELGLTPRQVKGLLNDWYVQDAVKGAELQEQQRKQEAEKMASELQKQHGDKLEAKKNMVRSLFATHGGTIAERLEKAGFGNDPELFNALAGIAEKFSEDSAARGGGAAGEMDSKASAERKIGELILDKEFQTALMNSMHPGHDAALKEWTRLHKIKTHGQ